MARNRIAASVLGAALLLGAPAWAGTFADDLGRCMGKAANPQDHVTLVHWMFAALSQHPAAAALATVNMEQRLTINKEMAALYERLLYVDCRKEAVAALKNEGSPALGAGFAALTQVAMRDLLGDYHVPQALQALVQSLDKGKQTALYGEAGVPEPKSP